MTIVETPCAARPLVLTIPGLFNSGSDHWQSVWDRERPDCVRIELGCWDDPIRNVWMSRVDQAVYEARGDVVLVAHSLGCHAVAWWAKQLGPSGLARVRGALLVALPDVDRPDADPRIRRFGPTPVVTLPFPTLVVTSRDDPYATLARSAAMAKAWGAAFVDVGERGHINAASNLGRWPQGQDLLATLVGEDDARRAACADRFSLPLTPNGAFHDRA